MCKLPVLTTLQGIERKEFLLTHTRLVFSGSEKIKRRCLIVNSTSNKCGTFITLTLCLHVTYIMHDQLTRTYEFKEETNAFGNHI